MQLIYVFCALQVSGSWVTPVLGYCGEIDVNRLRLNHAEVCIVYLSQVMTKPVFGVSDQVQYKPGCTTTEDG